MAAAGWNGALVPHRRPCNPSQHLRLIRDNPPIKWIYDLGWGGWEGVWPSTHYDIVVINHHHNIKAFWVPTPSQPLRKTYPLARGVFSDQLNALTLKIVLVWVSRMTFTMAVAMVRLVVCGGVARTAVVRLILGKVGIAGKLFLRRVTFFYFGMNAL